MVMHAIQVEHGALVWKPTARAQPAFGEVLIEVHATAVNRADLIQVRGGYPPPVGASEILGLECSGTVVELGEGVRSFRVGSEVCALLAGGGYAQYVNVPVGQVLPKPRRLTMIEAAALPEVFATAYLNIFMEAQARYDEKVLLHSGASGVGTAAIQLCTAFGNPCMVTVGSDAKIRACQRLGASAGVNRHTQEFPDAVLEWTDDDGVDIILDTVGGPYLKGNLHCLATDGRLVVIGLMGGAVASLPIGIMMVKRQKIIGSTLRARSIEAKSKIVAELRSRVWPRIDSGDINALVDDVVPIEQAQVAHELIRSDRTIGKIVLAVSH